MSDFRQPTPDYMAQELESERVKLEEVFFGGYRRPPFGPMMPSVEHEGSALSNPRIDTDT